jgi:hypothetical protein
MASSPAQGMFTHPTCQCAPPTKTFDHVQIKSNKLPPVITTVTAFHSISKMCSLPIEQFTSQHDISSLRDSMHDT